MPYFSNFRSGHPLGTTRLTLGLYRFTPQISHNPLNSCCCCCKNRLQKLVDVENVSDGACPECISRSFFAVPDGLRCYGDQQHWPSTDTSGSECLKSSFCTLAFFNQSSHGNFLDAVTVMPAHTRNIPSKGFASMQYISHARQREPGRKVVFFGRQMYHMYLTSYNNVQNIF